MSSSQEEVNNLAELLHKLYLEAEKSKYQPENKDYEEHNQEYIFRYMASGIIGKEKLISDHDDYQRGYNTGYKVGRKKGKL